MAKAGYIVLDAHDATRALQLSTKTGDAIDLLLTDVVMPGMSGPQLADELSPRRPGMRVLYMSGYTDGAIAAHGALESGISVLHKPFTRDQLVRRVEDALASVTLQ